MSTPVQGARSVCIADPLCTQQTVQIHVSPSSSLSPLASVFFPQAWIIPGPSTDVEISFVTGAPTSTIPRMLSQLNDIDMNAYYRPTIPPGLISLNSEIILVPPPNGRVPSVVLFPNMEFIHHLNPIWHQVLLTLFAIQPIQTCHINSIFPAYNVHDSFSDMLQLATSISAKELDLPAALKASHQRLTSPETCIDLDLIRFHESSILSGGLLSTLATAQKSLYPEALSPISDISLLPSHPFF